MGVVHGVRWVAILAFGGAAACNPFEAFAECDFRHIEVDSTGVDVEAASERLLGNYEGTLTWTRTGTTTTFFVAVGRAEGKSIQAESDCDGKLSGFTVPLRITSESDDGLVATTQEHELSLDETGAFKRVHLEVTGGEVSFEALKAQGLTPPDWVSNFFPKLSLPLSVPDLVPQDGTVAVDRAPPNSMTVLGEVTFP